MIPPTSSFLTYLWHYAVARLIYDHLLVAVVAVIPVVLFLRARRRR